MSADRIYLSREEQIFLIKMLEIEDPAVAVERFAILMVEERADPSNLSDYLKKIMKIDLQEYLAKLKKRGK